MLPGYFETIGVALLDGRLPTEQDYAAGLHGAVINASAERALFREGSAVGREFTIGQSDLWTVLGIVADIRHGGPLRERAASQVYLPFEPGEDNLTWAMTVVLRPTGTVPGLAVELRRAAQSIGPRVLVERIRSANDWFGDLVVTPRRRMILLSLLGGLGLVLALVGIFGMTAYAVASLVREAIGPLLDEVKVRDGDRVLDVGTGPGLVAAAAAERGADVIGIDFSEVMVAEARRRHPDLKFQKAAAESLPFEDGKFTAVVGNFVLHHVGQPEQALREAFRVLRGSGRMGFTVWADLSKLEAFGLFFAAVEEHAGSAELPHGPLFGVSDFDIFHGMVRGAGFRDSSVRELPIAWQTSSLDPYVASFADWANLAAFPKTVRDAIEPPCGRKQERTGQETSSSCPIPRFSSRR